MTRAVVERRTEHVGGSPVEALDPLPFRGPKRAPPTAANGALLVVHESVTRDARATVRVLRARKLSCHFGVREDGTVERWMRLDERGAHARQLNARAVGVELTSVYYPEHARGDVEVIDAPWAHRGRYVVPSLRVLEGLVVLADGLAEAGVIARRVEGFGEQWGHVDRAENDVRHYLSATRRDYAPSYSCVVAHRTHSTHADGAFPLLYLALRWYARLPPSEARAEAVRLATSTRARPRDVFGPIELRATLAADEEVER